MKEKKQKTVSTVASKKKRPKKNHNLLPRGLHDDGDGAEAQSEDGAEDDATHGAVRQLDPLAGKIREPIPEENLIRAMLWCCTYIHDPDP